MGAQHRIGVANLTKASKSPLVNALAKLPYLLWRGFSLRSRQSTLGANLRTEPGTTRYLRWRRASSAAGAYSGAGSAIASGAAAYRFSLVQTRSMSLVAASGQDGVNTILVLSGTFSSGASRIAGS